MNQHEFNVLLEKYLAGHCSEEEEKLLQAWSDDVLQQNNLSLQPAEKVEIEKRLWTRIRHSTFGQQSIIRPLWYRIGIAAAMALLLGLGWYFIRFDGGSTNSTDLAIAQPKGVVRIQNTSDKPQQVTLEDGSLVILKQASSLSYPEHFGSKTRSVILEGEAFFNIKRDPTKPFVVHTGELVTEVLGTSFTIKSYDHTPSIEVRVTTGRVSVYENRTGGAASTRNGVILTPNQRAVFDKSTRQLSSGLVEHPVVIHPPATTQSFVFEETPLPTVLKSLERAFGVEVVLENQALAACVLTADLTELPLYAQMDLICKSVNATYEQRGTVLFVNGEGCR
ncbi:DUF4974 domain-containing protein [Fibrisoma montanum]|uniref:DUF4974 domain-containing protein n=1 Tax=Fibrisoma montanum TaxID=2305895 RepID=A0A418M5Q1_9BACT|nr:FecR domain-containing protein [Fibrisoma montanum]RIV21192.1 DUF4974 domain-containing protein [Fibrisoma montanum]